MSLDRRIRDALNDASLLFRGEPIPEFSPPKRRVTLIATAGFTVVVAVIGLALAIPSTGPNPSDVANSLSPQTPDTTIELEVPEGFRPDVLATNFVGVFIAIDSSTGESIRFRAEDLGTLDAALSGTLLSDGSLVLLSDNPPMGEEYDSTVSVFDSGLSQVPTTLRSGFATSPSWLVPTPDPQLVWFVEGRPPWRIELHSVADKSIVLGTSVDLAENMQLEPVGATTDGLVLKTLIYEDLGDGLTPIPESESLFLIDSNGDSQHLGDGSARTYGPHAIYLYECGESVCTLVEIRTDTGDRREVSNRRWNTPTASVDTGEASDQWSVVNPSGTEILLTDDSGVVVLDLETMETETLPTAPFTLAAWTDNDEIILISEGSVQTLSADRSLRTVATIPEGFYVLDAGY